MRSNLNITIPSKLGAGLPIILNWRSFLKRFLHRQDKDADYPNILMRQETYIFLFRILSIMNRNLITDIPNPGSFDQLFRYTGRNRGLWRPAAQTSAKK